jgi:hypothetical protein
MQDRAMTCWNDDMGVCRSVYKNFLVVNHYHPWLVCGVSVYISSHVLRGLGSSEHILGGHADVT